LCSRVVHAALAQQRTLYFRTMLSFCQAVQPHSSLRSLYRRRHPPYRAVDARPFFFELGFWENKRHHD
jgi:hypothetical protein